VQPVLDVVAVQKAVVGAAGEGATVVAQSEGSAEAGGNGAGAAAGKPLVSYGGLARSRSQSPGPPSLRPAKLGYARPQKRRKMTKFNGTADRCPSGRKDRG
jgi:hypothetical protein